MLTSALLTYGGNSVDITPLLQSWDIPSLVLDDAYRAHIESGGDPYAWSGDFYARGPVTMYLSTDDLAAVEAVWRRGCKMTWDEDGETRYSYIWSAEPPRVRQPGTKHRVTLVGERGEAFDTGVEYAAQTADAWEGVFTFPGSGESAIPGDPGIPALTRVKAFWADAVSAAYIGVKPSPATGYDPLDDYSGTADATCVGGQKASALTMDLTYKLAPAAGPPTIDTAANKGWHLTLARVLNTAAAGSSIRLKARSTVSGSAITSSKYAECLPVALTLKTGDGFEVVNLGEVAIPAAQIPEVSTGAGYAAEAVSQQQTTENADFDLYTVIGGPANGIGQTVALTKDELITKFVFKTGTGAGLSAYAMFSIYATTGGLPTGNKLYSTSVGAVAASTTKTVTVDMIVPATGTYALVLSDSYISASRQVRYNTAGGYASGDAIVRVGTTWSVVTGDDLYFQVYTRALLGFNASNGLYATCSEFSKTVVVDAVKRIPLDAGAVVYDPVAATTAGQGILIDNTAIHPDSHNGIYLCDTDGIAPSPLSEVKPYGTVRLWPGESCQVVTAAYTPPGAAPGDVTISASAIGRYARLGSERP